MAKNFISSIFSTAFVVVMIIVISSSAQTAFGARQLLVAAKTAVTGGKITINALI
ncbi:hypothetical protein MKW92_027200 [Papaver armeniacum]|nr:hypothetical protein MKW92_027200 [Papaver armeniacum]